MAIITSAQTGDWSTTSTWVGGVVPGSGDSAVIAGAHVVTVDTNVTVGDLTTSITVNATGELVIGAFTLTLDGALNDNGIVTQNAGSDVLVNGNYDLVFGAGSSWDVNGTLANRCSLKAAATFGFSIQDAANSLATSFIATYCHLDNWGRADLVTDHALYWHGGSQTCAFELNNCLVTNYWRIRSYAGLTNAASTFKFTNCDYRSPKMLTGNKICGEYTTTSDHNANTRGWWDCTFVGASVQSNFFIDASTAVWTNPLIVSNCIGEDVLWRNRFSNYVELDVVTHCKDYTTAGSNDIVMSNRSTGQGGWVVRDSVVDGDNTNAHNTNDGGGDSGTPSTPGVWQDNIIFGTTGGDNHYSFDGGSVTFTRNISVGGNGIVSTSANSGTILIERHTHIHKSGNFDSLLNFETNNFTANSVTVRSCLLVGLGEPTERGLGSTTLPQDLAYADFNCWYQIADHYEDITVANNTLTEGVDTGFGANDLTLNPRLKNANATLGTWDLALGGAGTSDNAFAEMLKLNGYDRAGSSASFNNSYTKAALLAYLRNAFSPTNTSLRGVGYNGQDIGALAVSSGAHGGFINTMGRLGLR